MNLDLGQITAASGLPRRGLRRLWHQIPHDANGWYCDRIRRCMQGCCLFSSIAPLCRPYPCKASSLLYRVACWGYGAFKLLQQSSGVPQLYLWEPRVRSAHLVFVPFSRPPSIRDVSVQGTSTRALRGKCNLCHITLMFCLCDVQHCFSKACDSGWDPLNYTCLALSVKARMPSCQHYSHPDCQDDGHFHGESS